MLAMQFDPEPENMVNIPELIEAQKNDDVFGPVYSLLFDKT